MKIEAYKVDCCGRIMAEKDTIGISPISDMFERIKSYPFVHNPSKVNVHACMHCFRDQVLDIAEKTINRRNNEEAYKAKLDELSFSFRDSVVRKYMQKQDATRFKQPKTKKR